MTATGRPTPMYFGDPGARLFGWFHLPERQVRETAVVICNPVGDDYVRAHRTLRHLAENLSAAGYPVLRFDFHGTGDSSGDERDPKRLAAWRRDVGVAIDEARALSGVTAVSIIGMRLGATIAAEVASVRGDVASVVMWHPFSTGAAFTSETLRMHKMHRMLEPESFAAGPKEYPDGEEALGFFLTRETMADLTQIDLAAITRRPAPKVLVIDAANIPSEERLLERLCGLEAEVDYRHLPGHKFLISIPHHSTVPQPVIDAIVAWFSENFPANAPTTAATTRPQATHKTSTFEEQPFVAGKGQRLFGVLTRPSPERRRSDVPAIVLMNAGTVHRIGPHRFYVTMARELAELGFDVLRVDLSGIGDSPVAQGDENKCYPKDYVADVDDTMAALADKLGTKRFILTGLCSGADIAFQLGLRDRRVAGVVLMNPRTFCVHDLALVEAYKGARYYQDSFFNKDKWVKLLSGKVDVVRVARMMAPKVKGVARRTAQRMLERVLPRSGTTEQEHADVPACLRLMAERGVDTFLVTTVHDPGVDYVDVHFGKTMKDLSTVQNYRREDLAGTDHTFTSVWSQQHVRTTIRDHLASRHLT
jgi:alpha-beta hydrolase superfamily lysophospholipase